MDMNLANISNFHYKNYLNKDFKLTIYTTMNKLHCKFVNFY